MSWYKTVLILGVAAALCIPLYFDGKVPENIQEQWTVKVLDAALKTYLHVVSFMQFLGYMPFSDTQRLLADRFILFQITGSPWGLGQDPEIKITDVVFDYVPVRIYEPVVNIADRKRPVVVYIHGGGWIVLSIGELHAAKASYTLRGSGSVQVK